MSQVRPSVLITSIGAVNLLIGLSFVAFGAYALAAGADAVASLFQLQNAASDAVGQVRIIPKEGAAKVDAATDLFAKGLGGIIMAMVGVIAGCSIVQGLPLLLVGAGVLVRSNAARVFAIVFALVALLEGLACAASAGQSNRFLILGLVLLAYAILTFVALIGKRASFEFSGGLKRAADASEKQLESQPMNAETSTPTAASPSPVPAKPMASAVLILLIVLLVITSAAAASFATLYFTRKPVDPVAAQGQDLWPRMRDEAKKTPAAIDDTRTLALHKPKLAAFHDAILAGQIPRAAELLKDVDVDEPDEQGRTALMKAASAGNLRTAMFLIGMGAQLDQRDQEGKTPLIHATLKNQVGIIGIFRGEGTAVADMAAFRAQYMDVSKGGGNLNLKNLIGAKFDMPSLNYKTADNKGMTAYMYAVVKGYLEVADKLYFWSGGNLPMDAQGNTMLHLVAAEGNLKMVRHFFIPPKVLPAAWYYQVTPEDGTYQWKACLPRQTNQAGQEAWMLAAEKGHLEIVKHLLLNPTLADLQRKDNTGKTGSDLAAANGHKEVVAYLTQLQAEVPKRAAEEGSKKDKESEKKK